MDWIGTNFWFMRDPGLALPLAALSYTKLKNKHPRLKYSIKSELVKKAIIIRCLILTKMYDSVFGKNFDHNFTRKLAMKVVKLENRINPTKRRPKNLYY
jgi:hypothetical protein